MLHDPLDLIWDSADTEWPTFTEDDLASWGSGALKALVAVGALREGRTATHVSCDACTEGHVEEVMPVSYPNGRVRFFIACPENGRVEVERNRLLHWSVDYTPMFKAMAYALSMSAKPREVIPGRAWSLGRAAVSGLSRPIWAARGLGLPDAFSVAEVLPKGRSPVLFFLGQHPRDGFLDVPRESLIEMRTVVRLTDNCLTVDVDAVRGQLATATAQPRQQRQRRRASRSTAIDDIKRLLREHMRAARDHAYSARDHGNGPELLPRPTMQQLADQLKIGISSVSRAINDSSDKEVAILWNGANDIRLVMNFQR